jgi:hypothetical protein
MRARSLLVSVVVCTLLGPVAARAEEAGAVRAAAAPRLHAALGVNSPLSWPHGTSVGGSLYLGIGDHHAIRVNGARYQYRGGAGGQLLLEALGAEDLPSHSGHTSDVGLAWVYYPRRSWSGVTLELGVLRRARDHRLVESEDPNVLETRTTTYAGRAMVGWSWLIGKHVFVAVAAGISVGHESGTEDAQRYPDYMTVRTDVSRKDIAGEGLLRIGLAWDP